MDQAIPSTTKRSRSWSIRCAAFPTLCTTTSSRCSGRSPSRPSDDLLIRDCSIPPALQEELLLRLPHAPTVIRLTVAMSPLLDHAREVRGADLRLRLIGAGAWLISDHQTPRRRARGDPARSRHVGAGLSGARGSDGTRPHPVRARTGHDHTARSALRGRARSSSEPRGIVVGRGDDVLVIGPPVALAIAVPLLWKAISRSTSPRPRSTSSAASASPSATTACSRTAASAPTRWLKIVLASAGSLAVEGSVVGWVANHRRHHVFSDKPGDPHSPHVHGTGTSAASSAASRTRTSAGCSRPTPRRPSATRPSCSTTPTRRIISRLFPVFAIVSLAGAVLPRLDGLPARSAARSPRCCGPASPA